MKKLTKLMLTLTLLVLGVGGANAEKLKLYSTGFSGLGGNVSYTDGTLTWTAVSDNVANAIVFEKGVLSNFSKIKFYCEDLTAGAYFRVIVDTDDGSYLASVSDIGDGNVEINIADLGKQFAEATKITDELIASATKVRIGGCSYGGGASTDAPQSLKIDPTSIYLETSWDAPMQIGTAEDWTLLYSLVNAGMTNVDAELTANISTDVMIGSSSKPYSGVFNGNGNKLTVNYNSVDACAAPFRYVKNATIKNLIVDGRIESSSTNIAGVAGQLDGTTVIDGCHSSVDIVSTQTGTTDSNSAGIAGINIAESTITVTNCLFDGSITASETKAYCGIIGYLRKGTLTVKNNLVLGTLTGASSTNTDNIYRTYQTVDNSNNYYKNKFGNSSNGTLATEAQLISGEIAYNLQGKQETLYWGQSKLNTSVSSLVPQLGSSEADKVIELKMSNGSASEYANVGGVMPSPVDKNALSFNNGKGGNPFTSFNNDGTMSRCFNMFSLTVPASGATTLVLPVNVAELPDGIKAFNLTFNGTSVVASEVTSITANKPVLINANTGQYVFVSDNSSAITYDTENAQQNGALCGIFTDSFQYVPADSYVLQNGANGIGFYKVSNDNQIRITSFRAYLTAATPARALRIVYAGETTGIESMDNESNIEDYYDLQGRRVAQPTKGLYIVNGKKIIVK